jgi:lipopolysaccharide export system permease protein
MDISQPKRYKGIMFLLSRYLLKSTMLTTILISLILTMIIWLTQTLRLLDFVLNGGAPFTLFGAMLVLIIPKFFETILPLSLALGTVYSLNKFSTDSELVVMQNSGLSPLRLAQGLIIFTLATAMFIFVLSGWITPLANRKMDALRDLVKSEYSMGLMRPGIFNTIGDDTTVYIAGRTSLQDLRGVFVHMTKPNEPATTITAEQGGLITNNGKQLLVIFNGTRQQFNEKTGGIDNLKFERYSLDLSSLTNSIENMQRDPNQSTVMELWHSPILADNSLGARRAKAELHSRLSLPFLTMAFSLMSFVPFLIGRYNRRGQAKRMTMIVFGLLGLQIIHLTSSSLANSSFLGLALLYAVPAGIIIIYSAILLADANYFKAFTNILTKERLI